MADSAKMVRILVLIASLIAMIGLGSVTPGTQATISSRLIVFAFAFSMAIVMVTTVALIPSPPDPRERRRRILDGLEHDEDETDDDREPEVRVSRPDGIGCPKSGAMTTRPCRLAISPLSFTTTLATCCCKANR